MLDYASCEFVLCESDGFEYLKNKITISKLVNTLVHLQVIGGIFFYGTAIPI